MGPKFAESPNLPVQATFSVFPIVNMKLESSLLAAAIIGRISNWRFLFVFTLQDVIGANAIHHTFMRFLFHYIDY
jgi:hypothetical protein